jgi:hypothetical protein
VNWRRSETAMGGHHNLTEFEQFPGMAKCNEAMASCDVEEYVTGSPRDLAEQSYSRYHSSIIASYLANAFGHHIFKVGFDGEMSIFKNQKSNRVFAEDSEGTRFNDEERFGYASAPDTVHFIDPLSKTSKSMTVGGFLQDSWSVADKVTVNLGVRYDAQYFYRENGDVGLSLPNQWSPRLGLIYDPTQQGKAKMFVNYARYYENAPLDFADVILAGEPQLRGGHSVTGCNPTIFAQQRNQCQDPANLLPNTQDDPRLPNKIYIGGSGLPGTLDPDIKASSTDEYSAGGEYELFPEARLGLTLTHRKINAWIEDMSPVPGLSGFTGNPGSAWARCSRRPSVTTTRPPPSW